MANEEKKEVSAIYEELKGILDAIPAQGSWFDDDGFSTHANRIIGRIGQVCPEIKDANTYLIETEYASGRKGYIINIIPAKAKLNSIIGKLKGIYGLEMPPKNDGHTFIQNQSQNQSQTLNVILELHEKIIAEIPKHKEGTKERNFLEKLKSSLPTITSATNLMSSVLKIAADFGLDPTAIHTLLGL